MSVTLADLRTVIRKHIGAPSASQMSNADILTEINNYYRNHMPLQLDIPELKGTCTLTTATDESSGSLPDDTVKIMPPVRIGSGAIPTSYGIGGFYYEPTHFYSKHDGSEAADTPVDVLLSGRTVYYAPKADGVYKIVFPSVEKPTALSADDDTITSDHLRDIICISTSINVLNQRADDEAKASLAQLYPMYVDVLKSFGINTDSERILDAHGRMVSNVPSQRGAPA